jgi:CubicO group peptidase (beta-lactamase class C family)
MGSRLGGWMLLLLGLAGIWAAPVRSDPAASAMHAVERDELAAFVDGWVEGRMQSHRVAGATVSIVHDGQVIFARGYGLDDLERGRPVNADRSLFRPGSISKTFTWTAVMQLVEQGRLDLDADIRGYLPDFELPGGFDEPITLAHLMAHTPGFEDSAMGHLFVADADAVLPLADYLRRYQPSRVRPPGLWPAYSNFGTALAGHIVASVAGEPFEDYVDRHLLEPLRMADSTFREPWGPQRAEAPMPDRLRDNVSRGYTRHQGHYRAGVFEFIGQVGPAGAMATTAGDMARWMLAHLNGGELDGARILAAETARRMHAQHFTPHPSIPGMAHGFIESGIHGYRAIGHGGGTIHFLSDMQMIPELGFGVFVSTNTTGGGGRLIHGFVAAVTERLFQPGPGWPAPPEPAGAVSPAADYVGTYLATRRAYTTVERALMTRGVRVAAGPDDTLVAADPMGEYRFLPLGGDLFVTADDGQPIQFLRDEDGRVTGMLPAMTILVMERVRGLANPNVLLMILAASALVLACAVVGAWLRRRRPPPQTPTERWAGWVIVATAGVWLVTFALAAAGLAPLARDFASVFFAFPSPLVLAALGVALLGAVLTVLSALLLAAVWAGGQWPLWRRLRHTGVVLAAVAVLLVLRDLNAIGFHFLGG